MELMICLQKDAHANTGIVVIVDLLSKMAHLADVPNTITG